MPSTVFWSRSRTERIVTGPETAQDAEPEFDSIEERLAFAEIAMAVSVANGDENPERPPPDDPFAAFPD